MKKLSRRLLCLALVLLLVISSVPALAIPTDSMEQYEILFYSDFYTTLLHLDSTGEFRLPEDLEPEQLDPQGEKFMEVMDRLLEGYDQFTAFYPKELAEVYFPTGEPLVGVGVQLETGIPGLYLARVLEGGSAEAAGLLVGDQIVSIGGLDTRALSYDSATPLLRGDEGTTVSIEVRRPGESKNRSYTLKRAPVEVPYVTGYMLGDTGYLYYEQFVSYRDVELFAAYMLYFKQQGAKNLVIDLRANGGGSIDVAAELLCLFGGTEGETLFSLVTNSETDPYYYTNNVVWKPQELILLVSEYTASASELMVASLQSRGLATVIGQNTYGKAYGQAGFTFDSGDMLLISSFTLKVPKVADYQGVGLRPNIYSSIAYETLDLSYLTPLDSTKIILPGLAGAERIFALQERLALLGYYRAEPTGVFDAYTLHALNCFQQAEELTETRYGSLAALRALEGYTELLDGYQSAYDTSLEKALEKLYGSDWQSEVAA